MKLAIGCATLALTAASGAADRPNVLLIVVDDLNQWVGHLGRDPQVQTPNIDRFARQNLAFTRAYCPSPVCNPSRSATFSGRRAGSTGVYDNQTDWRKYVPVAQTLPAVFHAAGYRTFAAGKIFHEGFDDLPGLWDDVRPYVDDADPKPPATANPGVGTIRFGPLDVPDAEMQDHQVVTWLTERLNRTTGPFFMACGIHRPHFPLNVPRAYFDRYPVDGITLPPVRSDDWDDLPPVGRFYARHFASNGAETPRADHDLILESGRWREAVQAYLAAISFADAQVGRMLQALENSPHRANTIVVLWSDNGFHLGEKRHWRKVTLWEEATHVPMIWSVPGLTRAGTLCRRTVDLMAVYPTLTELCGLPTPAHVEGVSIKTLLANPDAPWTPPAITTARENDHTVRTEQWRYIRYHDGGEELYAEGDDPFEWHNLADHPQFAAIKKELAGWLPKINRPTPRK